MVAASAVLVCSCRKDFEPKGRTPEKYASEEKALEAVQGLYSAGAPTFYNTLTSANVPFAALGGYLSGMIEGENASAGIYGNCRSLSLDAPEMSSLLQEVWTQAVNAIVQADKIIDNIAVSTVLSDEQKSRLTAEARFFRAFNRFYLAKTFGQAPQTTQDAISGKVSTVNLDLAEAYSLIIDDLQRAMFDLPDVAFTTEGRVGRPAAQMLLADVYLTMSGYPLSEDHYRQAADMARRIIGGGRHILTPNGATPDASAYNMLRTRSDNPEYVYTRQVSASSLAALCLPGDASGWGVVKVETRSAYRPAQALIAMYDPVEDMRGREQQFFHSFVKYQKGERTVIQTFATMPYLWFNREALLGADSSTRASAQDANVIIYRYAEALLIAAEAIAMSEGVTAEAAGYLADVRARAWPKVGRGDIAAALAALGRERFVEEVWVERLREFPFEMKLWSDIQRTRKYPVIVSDSTGNKVTFRDVVGAANPGGITFEQRHLLMPVPKK